jgi:hypothetical protein
MKTFDWREHGDPHTLIARLSTKGVKQPTPAERKRGIVAHFKILKENKK